MQTKIKMQFDPQIAKDLGVEEAIMYSNIEFWVEHNKANDRNKHDGEYWTYNSIQAFCELFPFWTKRQIERILKKLKDNGYIKTGNYNSTKYDRTKWYTCITPKGKMEKTESVNGNNQSVEPIPDNKPDNKPDTTAIAVEDKSYGNEDINWVMREFETHRGFKSQGKQKQDRRMARHLLNNFTKEQITGMLLYLDRDEYAPRVGSVEDLWYKRGNIVAGIKKLQGDSAGVVRIS